MIAIIAEKPSVGQEIARVVGATEKKDGYITGNGYMVTWALGHLVSLALPGTYGYTRTTAEDLPMLPEPFRLVERQIRTDRGMVTDIAAGRQLKVIDGVFSECDSIIVATDAGREGELIFRWIYSHLGCTKLFKRLWFSSLTDEAIRKGMADLREGYEYDSLYAAADSRAKADWLVGMNASRALAAVSGSANNSIGRVQTPTLAMICARFKENRNFVSTPYWQLHITLKQGEAHRLFIHPEHFGDKKAAETAYGRIIPGSAVTITKVERGTVFQQAPLLYDLTSLQKDCNIHHDLTADKTLSIAQSLYEKNYVVEIIMLRNNRNYLLYTILAIANNNIIEKVEVKILNSTFLLFLIKKVATLLVQGACFSLLSQSCFYRLIIPVISSILVITHSCVSSNIFYCIWTFGLIYCCCII